MMTLLRKRKCPECGGEMQPRLINMVYTKPKCEIRIDVIGIPANVCTRCFYRIVPAIVAKYIDSLVDPIFESEMHRQERILPAPHIDIQFPPAQKGPWIGTAAEESGIG
jgi:hypothetical protein